MGKVLLVEDDNNLREIFEMRLQAEGYKTLSASDGEEALTVATNEKPELIIADVMMPKLSGFEMIETLRSAPEMGQVKVIMMTALGQAEDRARGEKLGVVKYLVKSQVTLEDFVRVVREVMPPDEGAPAATAAAETPTAQESSSTNTQESEQSMQNDNINPTVPPADDSAGTNPVSGGDTAGAPASDQMSADQQQNVVNDQVNDFTSAAPATPADPVAPAADPAPAGDSGAPAVPPASDVPAEGPSPDGGAPTPPPAGV